MSFHLRKIRASVLLTGMLFTIVPGHAQTTDLTGVSTDDTGSGITYRLRRSPSLGGGSLTLQIDSKDHLTKLAESPCRYSARSWTRKGSAGRPAGNTTLNITAVDGWTADFTRQGNTSQ